MGDGLDSHLYIASYIKKDVIMNCNSEESRRGDNKKIISG